MGKHGITSYPYKYMLEYKNRQINVIMDPEKELPYVLHNNKKLYFQREYGKEKIIKIYRSLIIEQDCRSAHRYVRSYDELKDKILLDIGSAEGIFALDTIELTKHVYIFECDKQWIAPLEATFAPWREKVSIIEKYVSDKTDEQNLKLDDFLGNKKTDNLFLKMDIEGAEKSALAGATETLSNSKKMQLAICTYHKKEDPEIISNLVASFGFNFEFTDGLMFWSKRLSKGLIRCYK
jgi:predicted RNA methylase